MTVTEVFSSSGYHVQLHLALKDAVEAYNELLRDVKARPPLTEESATAEVMKLHYAWEQKRITVILLAAACVEAIANVYLMIKASPEQFKVLDSATFVEKWVVLPSLFLKDYSFPKEGVLYQDLKLLQERRNALLHLKERVSIEGKLKHKGTQPKRAGDEDAFIGRCGTLPQRLAAHLATFDRESMMLLSTLGISL